MPLIQWSVANLFYEDFGGFVALATDVDAVFGVGNAHTLKVEELYFAVVLVCDDVLHAGLAGEVHHYIVALYAFGIL